MYDILIDYKTGSSFHSEDVKGESIGIVTSDLEVAKDNLMQIKKHYKKYNNTYAYDEIAMKTDNGIRKILPFWLGYFEQLHRAYIVSVNDKEMEFVP